VLKLFLNKNGKQGKSNFAKEKTEHAEFAPAVYLADKRIGDTRDREQRFGFDIAQNYVWEY